MNKILLVAITVLTSCGFLLASSSHLYAQTKGAPVSFSAEWGYYDEGELRNNGTYYAGPDAVRVEMVADSAVHHLGPEGGPYSVIYNLKDSVAWILDHTACTYSEQKSLRFGMYWSHWIGHFGAPCPQETRARRIGRETLQGRSVEKWRCTTPERHQFFTWYDTQLQTPVRIDIYQDYDEYFELSNIKEGPQPETLFVVPPGYISHTIAVHMEGEHSCPEPNSAGVPSR